MNEMLEKKRESGEGERLTLLAEVMKVNGVENKKNKKVDAQSSLTRWNEKEKKNENKGVRGAEERRDEEKK